MIGIIIVTHGNLGKELLQTAEGIIGPQIKGVTVIPIIASDGPPMVRQNLKKAIQELGSQGYGKGILILTDMVGGTPSNVSLSLSREMDMEVITGVNLYMLITACTHRESMEIKSLVQKVVESGRKNITDAKTLLKGK